MYYDELQFSVLVGEKIKKLKIVDNERVNIETSDGKTYSLYHLQDCCESVLVYETVGDLNDILNKKIISATETVFKNEDPEWYKPEPNSYRDSFTWTIYRLETKSGFVEIRWFGESNGYYSESVYFSEI